MTVTTLNVEVAYVGNGETTEYPVTFQFQEDSHVEVYLNNVLQVAGYALFGAGDEDGGTCEFDDAPAIGVNVLLKRNVPLTQPINPINNSTIFASVLARGLDRVTMVAQELTKKVDDGIDVNPEVLQELVDEAVGVPLLTKADANAGNLAPLFTDAQPYRRSVDALARLRSVGDQLRDRVSAMEYTVDPTGVADSTPAILKALAENPDKEIFFPAGTYRVTANIPVTSRIVGEYEQSTIFNVVGSGYDAFTLTGNNTTMERVGFTSATRRTSGVYVDIVGSARGQKIRNFYMENAHIGVRVGVGVVITEIASGEIRDCHPTGGPIDMLGGNDTFIMNVVADNSGGESAFGLRIQRTDAVWMTDNDFIRCGNGLEMVPDGDEGQYINWVFGVNNAFDFSVGGSGTYIRPTNGGVIRGVQLFGHWCSTNSVGFNVSTDGETGTLIDGIQLIAPRLLNNGQYGYFQNGAAQIINVEILDPTVSGNSTQSINGFSGILFGGSSQKFKVRGGRSGSALGFTATQKFGLEIGAGSTDYDIDSVDFRGNVTIGTAGIGASALGRFRNNLGGPAPWLETVPPVSAQSGALTSTAANLRYTKSIDNVITFTLEVGLTNIGTAGGSVVVTMPFAAKWSSIFAAREVASNGNTGSGTMISGSATMNITSYNNLFPGVSGSIVVVTGTYRAVD